MKYLGEGVKFGQKEFTDIIKRSKDFNVGIEFEIIYNKLPFSQKQLDKQLILKPSNNILDILDIFEYDSYIDRISNKQLNLKLEFREFYRDKIYKMYPYTDTLVKWIYYLNILVQTAKKFKLNNLDHRYQLFQKAFSRELESIGSNNAFILTAHLVAHLEENLDAIELFNALSDSEKDFILQLINIGEFHNSLFQDNLQVDDIIKILKQSVKLEKVYQMSFFEKTLSESDIKDLYNDLQILKSSSFHNNFLDTFAGKPFNMDNSALDIVSKIDFTDRDEFSTNEELLDNYISYFINYYNEFITSKEIIKLPKKYKGFSVKQLKIASLKKELKNYDESLMNNIDSIVDEEKNMVEIITNKMDVITSLEFLIKMFKFLRSDNVEINDYAGMHISISTNKYDLSNFNYLKFITLINNEYISKYFPEREHVRDINTPLNRELIKLTGNSRGLGALLRHKEVTNSPIKTWIENNYNMNDIVKELARYLNRDEFYINNEKHQTINFGDYRLLNGRIELRYFGGKDYHKRIEDIKFLMFRALFMMELGYTDLYNNQYYKQLYFNIDKAFHENYQMSYGQLIRLLKPIISTKNKNKKLKMANMLMSKLNKKPFENAEEINIDNILEKITKK